MTKRDKVVKVLTAFSVVCFVLAACCLVYAMYTGAGQIEGLNFGPGQYFYTDIPNWQEYFLVDYYDCKTPMWVLIALFFAWGFLMFKVWGWLDSKVK
jgi:hypothetical protein